MNKIMKKMALVLLIIIFIISINIKSFADETEWTKACKKADNVADFVLGSSLSLDKLKKAFDDNKIGSAWIQDCMHGLRVKKPAAEINSKYDEPNTYYIKFMDSKYSGLNEAKKYESTLELYIRNSAVEMGLDKNSDETNNLIRYVKAYIKLDGWKGSFETYAEKSKQEETKLDSDEDLVAKYKNYSAREMVEQFAKDGHSIEGIKNSKYGTEILNAWYKVIVEENKSAGTGKISKNICSKEHAYADDRNNLKTFLENWKKGTGNDEQTPIYIQPNNSGSTDTSEESLEDMVNDAENFTKKGTIEYEPGDLQNFSKSFYNIMLTVGVFVAVVIGGIIGLKLMTSGVEEKAEAKKLLVPYVVGCIVVFGGFAIWKIAVTILQNI